MNKKLMLSIQYAVIGLVLVTFLSGNKALSYLTDTEEVVNVVTVGDVSIDIVEEKWDATPQGKKETVVPLVTISKDPKVVNKGLNRAYAYMEISIPKKSIISAGVDGTCLNGGKPFVQELIKLNQLSKNWELLGVKEEAGFNHYMYAYKNVLEIEGEQAQSDCLFKSISLVNYVEGQLDPNVPLSVKVKAYAIQAEESGGDMREAWKKYYNQATEKPKVIGAQ